MVNIEKTKVMVFRKRGGILVNESWSYNGNVIEIVEQFNYFGFVISTNGSMKKRYRYFSSKSTEIYGVAILPYEDTVSKVI